MNRGRPMQNLRYTFFYFGPFVPLLGLLLCSQVHVELTWSGQDVPTEVHRSRHLDAFLLDTPSPDEFHPKSVAFKTWKCRLFKQPRKMMISETGNVC